ncbi:hypothetical protein MMC19_007276 [Ptychographa xylographoides]|nr:hypothetical protein [Ptychographa xylographoides]
MTSNTHEFLILGGNFAGISVAHYLLRHTIPSLTKLDDAKTYHVTLVSPSTHFFWKIGAPRSLATPDLIPLSKAFLPIADGFKEYSAEQYTIVNGTAVGLSSESRTVTVEMPTKDTRSISYSSLVIATGTSSPTAIWTLNGSHENSIKAMKDLHATLPSAKTILIAGGGPAGTETAGEIASLYPSAKTTILSGSTRLLSRLLPSTSKDVEVRLHKLGVEVIHNLRVKNIAKLGDGGKTELTFDDGSKRTVDVYIDSTGGKPNTSFVPASWLNERKQVLSDDKTLRLTPPGTEGIYVIGDAGSYSSGGIMDVNNAVAPVCSSMGIDIAKSIDEKKAREFKQRIFKPIPDTQFVPTGPKGGVGQVFGWRVPSLAVWAFKSRTFLIDNAPGVVTGSAYVKA